MLVSLAVLHRGPNLTSSVLHLQRRTLRNVTDPRWIIQRTVDKLYFCLLIMSLYWHRASFTDPSSVANIISILWMLALLPLFYAAFFLGALLYEMPGYLR